MWSVARTSRWADCQLLEKITVTPAQMVTVDDLGIGQDDARFYGVRWVQIPPF